MFNVNLIEKLKIKIPLIFNLGKNKKKTVGILNEGKNNTFINNKTVGFDIGMHDRGENTQAIDNEFEKE